MTGRISRRHSAGQETNLANTCAVKSRLASGRGVRAFGFEFFIVVFDRPHDRGGGVQQREFEQPLAIELAELTAIAGRNAFSNCASCGQ